MFRDKTVLITGGTGSWGKRLTRRLLQEGPREIRIFSRNEYAQVLMQREFSGHASMRYLIGDVRDYAAVEAASKGVDYVFHLAALKHVPVCEFQPEEALKTNVLGTENIIQASIANKVIKVIDVSTDKAVDPTNTYGMTKAIGEKLMIRANDLSEHTRFTCIRGGNVLGTNGSVVPLFINQLRDGKDLTITAREMTRFFLTLSQAIDLLLKAATTAIGGETFVMKMKACRIIDIAEVLAEHYVGHHVPVQEIGIRPGEKLHEVLVSRYEAPYTLKYSDQYYVILPPSSKELIAHYSSLPRELFSEYNSNASLLDKAEVAELLREGGFLN
ncbi:polysaccharide biosynthesis protein [Paenibacillus phoenicis]|uniref:Polysaccharide biosynthesis protein n=1 Tax=Paenibacillus phoenicis TaxID=554117 RepID=A0ABU5PLK4_9BACL|nr:MULTISPECIES: polysaccharide biosynthesis protein [Paenibacillus]MCT2194646.1 polysaccharide biosynthesis protein [Paenibacillus sp. p3-SID1389]MEA3570815.1 polysaccharide biosynthesis protein [Paenibacillus phoenicis]